MESLTPHSRPHSRFYLESIAGLQIRALYITRRLVVPFDGSSMSSMLMLLHFRARIKLIQLTLARLWAPELG